MTIGPKAKQKREKHKEKRQEGDGLGIHPSASNAHSQTERTKRKPGITFQIQLAITSTAKYVQAISSAACIVQAEEIGYTCVPKQVHGVQVLKQHLNI